MLRGHCARGWALVSANHYRHFPTTSGPHRSGSTRTPGPRHARRQVSALFNNSKLAHWLPLTGNGIGLFLSDFLTTKRAGLASGPYSPIWPRSRTLPGPLPRPPRPRVRPATRNRGGGGLLLAGAGERKRRNRPRRSTPTGGGGGFDAAVGAIGKPLAFGADTTPRLRRTAAWCNSSFGRAYRAPQ